MKKIFYLIAAIGIAWGVVSCDNEPKNPGDFSIKSELSIGDFVSLVTGESYPVNISEIKDTIFEYEVVRYDSIFDDEGVFEKRVIRDTIMVPATFTTKWYKANTMEFPAEADTFNVAITSNARWKCPTIVSTQAWPNTDAPAQWGGGDSDIQVNLGYNRWTFKISANMYLHTSDSTIFYEIPILQNPAPKN